MRFAKIFMFTMVLGVFIICSTGQALAAQYTVKAGDSLYHISNKCNISINNLKSNNGLKTNTIYPGQVLTVPSISNGSNYVVKSGDTLYFIGKRFNTTAANLKSINGLNSTYLYPGQLLKVPSLSSNTNYVVKKGDTLYLLAKKFGVTVTSIKSANGLKSDSLYVGQRLNINGGGNSNNTISNTTNSTANRAPASTASRGAGRYSHSEILLLARLINGEARGENYEGQVAVGSVVLNRIQSSKFPATLSGVIYQRNEFSVINDGQINLNPSQNAIKAAEAAMNGWDPSKGALYYWNPAKSPNNKFLNSLPIITRIGNHVFAK